MEGKIMNLEVLTKSDIYQLAIRARINRRSTMTKAQLIAAIEALEATDPGMFASIEFHYNIDFAPEPEPEVKEYPRSERFTPDLEGAEYWTAKARDCYKRQQESYDRCDTDGFMSQWAAGQMANRYHHLARLARQGWSWDYHAIFDLEGNLIPAKYLETRYGWSWALLESDDADSRIIGWFNESAARDPKKARANNAAKGFYVGLVRVAIPEPHRGYIPGERAGERADGGFSRDVEILDNGQ
jgi:hypothetical protein